MAVELIYETHSISVDNETGIASGWLPGELSERGEGLARELGERRQDDDLAVVYSSDLRRAVQTAEIAFAGRPVEIRQDRRLRECDYGELNGMPVERLHGMRSRHIDEPWPGGQSYRQVVERTRDFLGDVIAEWDGCTVLVVAHAANRFALDHIVGGVPLEDLVDAPFDWRPGWTYRLVACQDGSAPI
ncbi:histidine phosphatase family protein [Streptosporangium sp. KLBMP 9127]|nr:histidine phosphatase family protein [Streptosporangium sp. KLBMP 9127]